MANVKLNPILERIRGQIGDLVFKRYGDRVLLARKPDLEGRPPTEAQLAHQARFKQAALYGKVVMADPEVRAMYEDAARVERKPVFSLTVADFLNAPAIEEVDLSSYSGAVGDTIAISAVDDFQVVGVQVVLSDGDGNELEAGEATPGADGRWAYTATSTVAVGTTVRIDVTASDRPGGIGEATAEKAL